MKMDSDVIIDIDNRGQGKRSDLDGAIEDAKAGQSDKYLWTHHATVSKLRWLPPCCFGLE